jgi:soluble lytic murein transglycosylase-like protein
VDRRLSVLLRNALVAVAAVAAAPLPAAAQIYVRTDLHGRQVWSDRPIDQPTAVYAVHGSQQQFSTRPMADPARVSGYDPLIEEHATRHDLRPELVRAVIQVESGFNPHAVSPKGAVGLMQLMPATARELGVRNAYDPTENIRGGTAYLRHLLDRYDGNEELALAAYNAGAGAVDRSGRQVPAYRETREYVRKVSSAAGRQPVTSLARAGSTSLAPGKLLVYKWLEITDGRAIPKYSSTPPRSGSYDVVRP